MHFLPRGVNSPINPNKWTAHVCIRQVFGRDFRREFAKQPADDTGGRNEVQRVCSAANGKTRRILLGDFSFAQRSLRQHGRDLHEIVGEHGRRDLQRRSSRPSSETTFHAGARNNTDIVRCAKALHILDRFHIVAKMNDALDDVRAAEARPLVEDGYEPVLAKIRWCVLKRSGNLTAKQCRRLRDLLRYNPKTVRAYLLKEVFQQFWQYESPIWVGKFLDDWCRQLMRSRIKPMKKIAKTLRRHRELLLNYFRAKKQISGGVVEGMNNKAKLTMRKSYGFRTFRMMEIALYHTLGKLPEPPAAHRFY
jgi:Transposase